MKFFDISCINLEGHFVPVTEFCEWEGEPGSKRERWFSLPSSEVFAGIWRPAEDLPCSAFLTCEPNPLVAPIHPKAMPVIFNRRIMVGGSTAPWTMLVRSRSRFRRSSRQWRETQRLHRKLGICRRFHRHTCAAGSPCVACKRLMVSDGELWACANEMIRQHGADAPIHAAMRADKLLSDGEHEGAATWRLIVHRVNKLLAKPEGPAN